MLVWVLKYIVFYYKPSLCCWPFILSSFVASLSKESECFSQEMQTEPSKAARLGFISGVVPKAKAASFERILFRATRGNMFLKQAPIEGTTIDPATGEEVSAGW